MTNKHKYHYECINCDSIYNESQVTYLCPLCSESNIPELPPKGVLKTVYNYKELKNRDVDFAYFKQNNFLDLLPIQTVS